MLRIRNSILNESAVDFYKRENPRKGLFFERNEAMDLMAGEAMTLGKLKSLSIINVFFSFSFMRRRIDD